MARDRSPGLLPDQETHSDTWYDSYIGSKFDFLVGKWLPPFLNGNGESFAELLFGCEVAHDITIDIGRPKLSPVSFHHYAFEDRVETFSSSPRDLGNEHVGIFVATNLLESLDKGAIVFSSDTVKTLKI